MAEEPTEEDADDMGGDEDGAASDNSDNDGQGENKKGGKGKLIAIIVVAFLIISGGAGGGLYFMGFLDSILGLNDPYAEEEVSDDPPDLGTPVYHELPEFIADLVTGECRSPFLKLALTIQVDEMDLAIVLEREPKIIDRFQQHLRGKERHELSGKDGAETLRAELTLILDATLNPVKTQNVLFRSMVVQ